MVSAWWVQRQPASSEARLAPVAQAATWRPTTPGPATSPSRDGRTCAPCAAHSRRDERQTTLGARTFRRAPATRDVGQSTIVQRKLAQNKARFWQAAKRVPAVTLAN